MKCNIFHILYKLHCKYILLMATTGTYKLVNKFSISSTTYVINETIYTAVKKCKAYHQINHSA